MRARALAAALVLAACVPRGVPLGEAERASTGARVRVGTYTFAPPAGRWIVEPLAPRHVFDAAGDAGGRRWRELLDGVAQPSGEGVRLCKLSRVRWETAGGGATDPRSACASLQSIVLAANEPGRAEELAARLAPRASAIEVEQVAEPEFWRGVAWTAARGDARVVRIAAHQLVDLHLVARDSPSRVLRAGGRVLLLVGTRDPLAIAVGDAELIAPGSELWRVIESIERAAP